MTDADKPAFLQAISRLCVALREKEPDVVQMRVYFDALKPLEIEFVQMAAERLAQQASWFPKTSEWRAVAVQIEYERTTEQRAILHKRHTPLCLACDDTGWEQMVDSVKRCACQVLRRLEVLGRQPMPKLLDAGPDPDPTQETRALALADKHVKGMR